MTITVDITPKEFAAIKTGDKNGFKQNFIIVKSDKVNAPGDSIILHEQKEDGSYTGQELTMTVAYIIGDHVGMRKDYRTIGLSENLTAHTV